MNIIDAICCMVNTKEVSLTNCYNEKNRANSTGDSAEIYVKNLFANSFGFSKEEREKKWNETFSYQGNNSNPPDAMLRCGDAIEIKKIEKCNKEIQLNSSYPKQKLFANNHMISDACRNAESWTEKDLIYVIAQATNNSIQNLCFVYGLDICAKNSYYENILNSIKENINQIQDIVLTETKELGKIKNIGPLENSYLRIRPMWGLENPWKTFEDIHKLNSNNVFNFFCIINESKWNTFDNTHLLYEIKDENFNIKDIEIKDPDDIGTTKNAKLITYFIK